MVRLARGSAVGKAALVLAMVMLGGAARGQGGPYVRKGGAAAATATAPAKAGAGIDKGRLQAIVTNLGSAEFAAREAAQKELEKAGVQDREALKALAEGSTDAEVKARLLARYGELEEAAALNPPPISIDVKDASLSEVVAALNHAMGWSEFTAVEGMRDGTTYTLKAVDEPFWEVFMKLNQQGEIVVQPFEGLRMMRGHPGIRRGVVSGPFVAYATELSYARTADLQRDEGEELQPARLTLSFGVAVDPRVQVVSSSTPMMTSVVDDAGHELTKGAVGLEIRQGGPMRRQWMFAGVCPLEIVPGGKTIVSAEGKMRMTVMVSQQKVEVADVGKQGNTPVEVGPRKVTFTRFEVKDGRVSVGVNADGGTPVVNGVGEGGVMMTLVDANERTLYSATVMGNFSGAFGGQFAVPIKAVLTVPTKVKVVEVPFELKDLPLPLP